MKVVIIGAVALGPKTACRIKRLMPEAEVVMVDRDSIISYGGCGIPYYVSGDVSEPNQLRTTSFHMVRDEVFFAKAKDVKVLSATEAVAIDRLNKHVSLRHLESGRCWEESYDKLVLATGSIANRLPIPGSEKARIFQVANLHDAVAVKELIARGEVSKPLVIGGGAIGLEMVEAFCDLWGLDTALIEVREQLLPGLVSANMAAMVKQHLHENGVLEVYTDEKVLEFGGEDRVEWVKTDKRTIETDLVITAVGVKPNANLAAKAGLEITAGGAVKIDEMFRTSDPDIYAGGDCVENINLVTGASCYFPSGSLANRHGRIIGSNICGEQRKFSGIAGTFILKIFDMAVASTGLSQTAAERAGFDSFSTFVVQGDKAHFYPGMDLMYLEMTADRQSGRVLGVQGLSNSGEALSARINAVSIALKQKALISDISDLEVAYAPPFSAAMDVINALANTAENILAGKNRVIDVDEFSALFSGATDNNCLFLDVRGPANAKPFVNAYPGLWVNIPQDELRERMAEVPRDKELILICNSGVRSYEAQITLDQMGIVNTRNLQGGVAAIKKVGLKLV